MHRLDRAGVERGDLVLHLHCLDDGYDLAGLDVIALGDLELQHRALHRRDDRALGSPARATTLAGTDPVACLFGTRRGRQAQHHVVAPPVDLDRDVPRNRRAAGRASGRRDRLIGECSTGIGPGALNQTGAGLACRKLGCAHDDAVHRQERLWPDDLVLIERAPHAGNRTLARRVPDEQLRNHWVVAVVDLAALLHARLDADTRTARRSVAEQLARRRRKAVGRIFGIDTTLDRVATHDDVGLGKRQGLARGDEDLLAHQIDTRDQLGDRMLDLDSRVHLEEEEIAVPIEQALDSARADVADGLGSRDRHRTHPRPQLLVDGRRRGLLDDLLMPALQRAIALAEMHRGAVRVGHHLDLDVPRILDVLLDVDRAVAKPGLTLALSGLE